MEVKKKLALALNNFLEPIRERRARFDARPGLVDEILAAGAAQVRPISQETLDAARDAMGLGRNMTLNPAQLKIRTHSKPKPRLSKRRCRNGTDQVLARRKRNADRVVQHPGGFRQAPAPPIHPATGQPIGPEALAPLFPMDIIMQEASVGPYATRFIDIPEEVQEIYRLWRPTPLMRARRLEKLLDTPAQIYYKYEGVSPVGSHKPNTAIPQVYYNKKAGTKRIATETGAGQWGSAVAFAASLFGLEAKVYMVNVSYQQKPYRRMLMETYGAKIVASPSRDTKAGQKFLAEDPNHSGSLGIAISEALEDTVTTPDTKYSIGSVFNHVLLHQTIIGEEALKQMEKVGAFPDIVIGCIGGGSNFGGIALPFVRGKLKEGRKTRIIAVEPTAAPSLTKGIYTYDFGDTAQMTPLVKMYTLGSAFIPAPIHAGGLRYHGMAPIVLQIVR